VLIQELGVVQTTNEFGISSGVFDLRAGVVEFFDCKYVTVAGLGVRVDIV